MRMSTENSSTCCRIPPYNQEKEGGLALKSEKSSPNCDARLPIAAVGVQPATLLACLKTEKLDGIEAKKRGSGSKRTLMKR